MFIFPRYFLLLSLVNGGYSNWTLSKSCSVSCGDGVEIWRRFCNNPEPEYSGHNCSGLGNSTEFRNCIRKPCPSKVKTVLDISAISYSLIPSFRTIPYSCFNGKPYYIVIL